MSLAYIQNIFAAVQSVWNMFASKYSHLFLDLRHKISTTTHRGVKLKWKLYTSV